MADASSFGLLQVVGLLGAATVAVPLFRRLGLGSVLGYLAGGLAVGPFGIGLIDDPEYSRLRARILKFLATGEAPPSEKKKVAVA